MHRTILLLILSVFVLSFAVNAQGLKRRDGLLSLDGKPYLTYEVTQASGNKIYAYHALGEKETLFQAHFCSNWTYEGGDNYRHYYFPGPELELILPAKRKYRFQVLLPLMVKEGVLDEEANMNREALREFIAKYHVPLPPNYGPKEHQLPVIGVDRSASHRWQLAKDDE